MKTYSLLRKYCILKELSRLDTLALLAQAIIEDAPDDAVFFADRRWACLSDLREHDQAIIKSASVSVEIDTNPMFDAATNEQAVLNAIQTARNKILPARVNKSIREARRLISEGEALLRTEERELERCISTIYQAHASLENVRANKKASETNEMVRMLREMQEQCAKLEAELKKKGALPK